MFSFLILAFHRIVFTTTAEELKGVFAKNKGGIGLRRKIFDSDSY